MSRCCLLLSILLLLRSDLKIEVLRYKGINWILQSMFIKSRLFGESFCLAKVIFCFEFYRLELSIFDLFEFQIHNFLKCFWFFYTTHLLSVVLHNFLDILCVVDNNTCFSSERARVLLFRNILYVYLKDKNVKIYAI